MDVRRGGKAILTELRAHRLSLLAWRPIIFLGEGTFKTYGDYRETISYQGRVESFQVSSAAPIL